MKSILSDTTPKSKKSTRCSADIFAEIQSVPVETRIARSTAIGIELEAAEIERWCINSLTIHNGGESNIDEPGSRRGSYINLGSELAKAANLRWLADKLAASPQVIEARAILDPLMAGLAEAKEREQAQAHAAALATRELEAAKAAARVELEGQIDQHPAVVAAAKNLAPFRRLGELVPA